MKGLVLHQSTEAALNAFVNLPAQSYILAGATGSGKLALALAVSEAVIGSNDITAYPYALTLKADNGSIGIDEIRRLEKFLALKVPAKREMNRVIIVENAHLMTLEAQNALLKMLEEPPEGSLIILTVNNLNSVLPTILSRSQYAEVKRPAEADLRGHFSKLGYDSKDVENAYLLSGGLPGLMAALLAESEHPLRLATETGRRFLRATRFERLSMADELAKQKPLAENMVYILQQMANVSLQKATGGAAKRWQDILSASFKAAEELALNGQTKLVLTNLALAL